MMPGPRQMIRLSPGLAGTAAWAVSATDSGNWEHSCSSHTLCRWKQSCLWWRAPPGAKPQTTGGTPGAHLCTSVLSPWICFPPVSPLLAASQDYQLLSKKEVNDVRGFPSSSDGKAFACNAGDLGSIPRSGRATGEGMATHSSILAWNIPWTEESGGLQSMGSHGVGHDWATNTHTHSQWEYSWHFPNYKPVVCSTSKSLFLHFHLRETPQLSFHQKRTEEFQDWKDY